MSIGTLKKLPFTRSVAMVSQATRFDLPGFTLPLDFNHSGRWDIKFPNALDSEHVEGGYIK